MASRIRDWLNSVSHSTRHTQRGDTDHHPVVQNAWAPPPHPPPLQSGNHSIRRHSRRNTAPDQTYYDNTPRFYEPPPRNPEASTWRPSVQEWHYEDRSSSLRTEYSPYQSPPQPQPLSQPQPQALVPWEQPAPFESQLTHRHPDPYANQPGAITHPNRPPEFFPSFPDPFFTGPGSLFDSMALSMGALAQSMPQGLESAEPRFHEENGYLVVSMNVGDGIRIENIKTIVKHGGWTLEVSGQVRWSRTAGGDARGAMYGSKSFFRSVSLPKRVNPDEIEDELVGGVLTIKIPLAFGA